MGLFSDNFQTLCVGLIKYHHILVDFFLSLSQRVVQRPKACAKRKKRLMWAGAWVGIFFLCCSNLLNPPLVQSFLRRARNGFSSTCTVSRTTSKASTRLSSVAVDESKHIPAIFTIFFSRPRWRRRNRIVEE